VIEKVYLSSKAKENASLEELHRLCRKLAVPVEIDDRRIARLSVKENCFAIGVFKKFEDTLRGNCHILLCEYEDEGFLGTTLRSAVSFDQKEIALIGCHADVFDPKPSAHRWGQSFTAVCLSSLHSKNTWQNIPVRISIPMTLKRKKRSVV
jgi:TrmH family RNA methyltransferase